MMTLTFNVTRKYNFHKFKFIININKIKKYNNYLINN